MTTERRHIENLLFRFTEAMSREDESRNGSRHFFHLPNLLLYFAYWEIKMAIFEFRDELMCKVNKKLLLRCYCVFIFFNIKVQNLALIIALKRIKSV